MTHDPSMIHEQRPRRGRARLRRLLDLDRAPLTRREVALWAFVAFCLMHEPGLASKLTATLAGVGAAAVAALRTVA